MTETESVTPITVETSPAILLAEDDPVTRMLMTRFLKNAGYEVDAVANGSEALDKMTKRYYPMLVTDWEMPEMDGIALVQGGAQHAAGWVRVRAAADGARCQGTHHRGAGSRRR